jgi:hypothetical protein
VRTRRLQKYSGTHQVDVYNPPPIRHGWRHTHGVDNRVHAARLLQTLRQFCYRARICYIQRIAADSATRAGKPLNEAIQIPEYQVRQDQVVTLLRR